MNNKLLLPTGKAHISYSELKNWKECSHRHHLQYIQGIDLSEENEFLIFGTAIHNACEEFIETKQISIESHVEALKSEWEKFQFDDAEKWAKTAKSILEEVPDFINETFPNWEGVKAEEKIFESVKNQNISFKGFIDAVIKAPNKKGKTIYHLLDWKTANWGWKRQKKQDFMMKAQLIYYKNFWSQKHNIPLKDIRCGFVLLKRSAKKGGRCELVPISVGEKTSERAFKIIDNMVYSLRSGASLKNRMNCGYCQFKDTKFCPSWLQETS